MNGNHIAAVVLAAGASARLGKPKQLVQITGSTLVHRTIEIALNSGCSPVIVVLGANAKAVREKICHLKIQCITNEKWMNGMGTSIACGVKAASVSTPAGCVILQCDQIKLNIEVLSLLIDRFKKGDVHAVASAYDGTIGPPTIFSKLLFKDLLNLKDDNGGKRIFTKTNLRDTVNFSGGEIDLDTEEQLRALNEDHINIFNEDILLHPP